MALTLPLAVRFQTARDDRHVTADLRDFEFRSAVPGGYASATFSLHRPISGQPGEIDYFGRVYVYDRRSGAVVWEGRLEDPGRGTGDGPVWDITAMGSSAHARDQSKPLIYIDRGADSWSDDPLVKEWVQVETATDDNTDASMFRILIPRGTSNPPGLIGGMVYRRCEDAGHAIGRLSYFYRSGVTDGLWRIQAAVKTSVTSSGTMVRNGGFDTAGASPVAVKDVDWTGDYDVIEIRVYRDTSTATPANDNTWTRVVDPVVQMVRFNQDGSRVSGYPGDVVYSSWIAADLLGRMLPWYDGANAVVTPSAIPINDLVFENGVTPAEVFDALADLDPAMYWAAWESDPVTGLWRFEFVKWPTTVRYDATAVDGFDSPASGAELYSAVTVFYTDGTGRRRSVRCTQTVDALTAAGLVREASIEVDSKTAADATSAGNLWLAERAVPPNAGTLTVGRPILDRLLGCMVMPWEIKPGNLIRVREVLPRLDSLNPTDRDGSTVFRIVSNEFQASSAAATLELDSYSLSTARAIARARSRQR